MAECPALLARHLADEVMDEEPGAWHRLRTAERVLRNQREDRRGAEILHRLVIRTVEDYGNW
ncbi:hypothetical protein [Streptomyces nanhaiensis]|uniref:hypothetical protein n=1 Tax=Streptomyces nanhaiensis TaxID=679319 RepID=UPI00399C5874